MKVRKSPHTKNEGKIFSLKNRPRIPRTIRINGRKREENPKLRNRNEERKVPIIPPEFMEFESIFMNFSLGWRLNRLTRRKTAIPRQATANISCV